MANMTRILQRLHGWFVGHHPDHHNAECYLLPVDSEYSRITDEPHCGRPPWRT